MKSNTLNTVVSVLILLVVNVQSQSCLREDSIVHISRPGDVIIGGLFKIHESTEDGSTCTNVTDGAAIQRVEAFLYTVDRINKQNLVPGVKFGKSVKCVGGKKMFWRIASTEISSEFPCFSNVLSKQAATQRNLFQTLFFFGFQNQ